MQQYQFIIPEKRDSDKLPHTNEEWTQLADSLLAIAGGFTTDGVKGYWWDRNGKIVSDSSKRFTIAVEDSEFGELYDIAVGCLSRFDQQCIYFVHPDGRAVLITP